MSRGGGVGGPATLSSFRVQKAFSINFRENKRLRATLRLIEGDHMRAIRQVKQEITETKLWLKGVQENTGYSQHGVPNTERQHMFSPTASRRMSLPASIASTERASPRPTTRGRTSQADIMYGQTIEEGTEPQGQQQQSVPSTHVRFAWTEQGPRRASRDPMSTAIAQPPPPSTAGPETGNFSRSQRRTPYSRNQSFPPKEDKSSPQPEADGGVAEASKSQKNATSSTSPFQPDRNSNSSNNLTRNPKNQRQNFHPKEDKSAPQPEANGEVTEEKKLEKEQGALYGGALEKKPRILSGASVKSNQSLNAYQRRHILQSMVVKKRSSLNSKKEIHTKECARVNTKVMDYLNNLAERMKITLPDVSMFEFDPDKHNTPFAQNVNIT